MTTANTSSISGLPDFSKQGLDEANSLPMNAHELVIFDAGVDNLKQLIDGIKPGIDWAVLNANQDGIEQITHILANYSEIQTLHIVSHGAPGCLFLGNTQLSLDTLEGYTTQLQNWFVPQVGKEPSLLLYGCKVAAGDAGEEFIDKLHKITQANIAASQTRTGSVEQSGNWNLEITIGCEAFPLAFTLEAIKNYTSVLDEKIFDSTNEFEDYLTSESISDESKVVLTSIFNTFDAEEEDPNNTQTAKVNFEDGILQVTYLGNSLSLDALIPDVNVPGFEFQDLTEFANLDFPSIPIIGQPSLIIQNPTDENDAQYTIGVTDFSISEFINQITNAAGVNLNNDLKNALEGIGKFDLAISENKFSLNSSEDSEINIANLFPDNSEIKEFLEQIEPALILSDLEFSYEVDENDFPGDDDEVDENDFPWNSYEEDKNNFPEYDDEGYENDFPGDDDEVDENNPSKTNLSLSSKIGEGDNITDVAIDFQGDDYEISVKDFAAGEFIGSLATAAGVNLNNDLKNALEGIGKFDLAISENKFSLNSSEDSNINIANLFPDNSEIKGFIEQIEPALILSDLEFSYEVDENDQTNLSLSSKIGEGDNITDVAIDFQGDDYEISVKDFAAGEFIGSLATAAGVNLNNDLKNALEGIGKFDLAISENKFSLNSSEDSNINIAELFPDNSEIKEFLEKIEPALILSDLEFSYEVDENDQTNLSLSSKIGEGDQIIDVSIDFQGDDYEIEVKDFAAGEFIGSLATAAGVNLNNDLKNALEGIGKFDLGISQDEFSLKSAETITIDLLEIASIDTPVDSIDEAINNAVKDVLGDTKIIFKPELAYSFTDKKLTLATEIGEGENPDRVSLEFGNNFDVKLEYKIGEELSLGSLVSIDELQDVSFEDLTFIAANYTDTELKEFIKGFNFSGELNFQEGDDIISKFFRDELNILELDADLQVGDQVNIAANAETDWNLIGDGKGDFTVTLSQIGLGLKIDGVTPEIGIDGTLKLKDYDPSQANEPELLLIGGLSVDSSSLNAQFALETGSNQAWTNPFGLTGVALRDFGIQAGIGPSGLDNFGIRGDLKYGTIDINAAFSIDVTDPDQIALVLTLNEPVSLVQLISGPVNPFIFGEGASDNVLTDTFEFLDDIIDIEADSLKDEDDRDNDGDTEEKLPLIQFVPFEGVEIAGEILEEGFGINAKVTAWGAEAELQLGADTDFSKFEGSLSLKNIDLGGVIKIAGADANDDELNLDILIDTKDFSNSYFSGDGRLEILGHEVAKADFKISSSGIEIREFDLDLFVAKLDVNDLAVYFEPKNIDGVNVIAQGNGSFEILGHQVAGTDFKITTSGIDINYFNLDVGVFELNVNDFSVNFDNQAARGQANVKVFGHEVAAVDFDISSEKFELKDFDLDFGIVGLDVDNLVFDNVTGKASGSGSLDILGYEVAEAEINTVGNQLMIDGSLDLFGIVEIDDAEIIVQGSDSVQIGGVVKIFGQELASSNISIQGNQVTFTGGIGLDLGFLGDISANLTVISDGTLAGSTVKVDTSLGSVNLSLGNLANIDDLVISLINEFGGAVADTFNDAVELASDAWNETVDVASDIWDALGNAWSYGVNTISNLLETGTRTVTNWIEGFWSWFKETVTEIFTTHDPNDPQNETFGDGNDAYDGKGGNDQLYGGSGNDSLRGGRGNDSLYGQSGNDYLDGQSGNDYLSGGSDNDTLNGGSGNDYLDGGSGNDSLLGENSNDYLDGASGNDYLFGGSGNDKLEGKSGRDSLLGGWGDDLLIGGNDNDTLWGHGGNDWLEGNQGSDVLYGHQDNDLLFGHQGNDKLEGGEGNDLIYGEDDGKQGQTYSASNPNNDTIDGGAGGDALYGGLGNDSIDGGEDDDFIDGGEGNDSLNDQSGNDTLYGGDGNDTLDSGNGNDTIDGGEGNDFLVLSGAETDYTFTETSTGWIITDNRDNSEKTVTGVEEFLYKLEGSVANGPLANATAFIDTNGNFQLDAGETQTTTDSNGEYDFAIDPEALDRNGDGEIDPQEAQIVVTGGIDTTTGLPGAIPLISQVGSTSDHATTSPLTTLKAVLASQDIEADQVETLLNKISGLDLASLSQPLDNFDPYAAVGDDDTSGINIASGHIKVMNLFINGTAFLEAAGYQGSDAQVQVIFGLSAVLQTVNSFDLSQSNDLQTLFSELSQQLNLSADSEVISAVSELVAESNNLVDNLVEEALSRAVSDVLLAINPIKQAVYSSLPEVTTQLVAGEITTEEAQTQLQELLNSDTYLVQYALNENRTVTVTASNEAVISDENIASEASLPGETNTRTSATVTEGEDSHGHFIITLGEAAPAQGLKILYTLSGTATLGQDYESENGQFGEIIVAPGATQAIVDLTMLDDEIAERRESITINLRYVGDGYVLDPNAQSAVLDITDNDEAIATNAETGMDQTGTSGDDSLVGTAADDYISGNSGDDMVFGQAGNDDIMGAAGKDTVFGGQGNDNIEGNFGADVLHGNKGDDILAGGSGDDAIAGHEGSDQLHGDSGDDDLQGNEGNDVIKGGKGNDLLKGNQDNDWLLGGSGEDILMGGQGVDLFNGGEGADVFFFNVAAEGGDLILDFDPTQGDRIQVSEIGFNNPSIEDFSFVAGTLYFQDEELALIQNNGQTYNHFADLSEILEIVSEPTRPEVENTAVLSANITPRVPDLNLVENPETTILDEIIQRGQITVATSDLGSGFDLEFARTLAAALFGDASQVATVNASAEDALGFVANGTVDLAAPSFNTLGTDATLNIDFSPTYFYNSEAESVQNIALALPENDSQWADVVHWVNYVPVQAEEFGIDSQNIYQLIEANTDENENNDSAPEIRRFLGLEGNLGETLGLPNDFAVQVIQQVGNSAEIHERHFPELERDRNLLWTDGGLLYSPPFSGSPIDGELIDNNNRNLLAEVLERGSLKLGLPGNNPGFAVQQTDGEYVGFDVDLGRAIAAAIFGDASKLEIQTQSFKDSFANTANGVVDVSAMGITKNLVRDASLGIDYSPTYLYTGQGILVKADSGIDMLPALNGRRIGVLEGATALQNLQDSLGELGGTFTPVTYGSNDELFSAYEAGDIDAVSTDLTILSARIPTLSNPEEHQLLDDVLSKEPLALITDENQSEWADVVRWVTHTLATAARSRPPYRRLVCR